MTIMATLRLHTPMPSARPLVESRFATPATSMRITTSCEHGMEACELGFDVVEDDVWRHAWLSEPILEYRDFGHATVSTGIGDRLFQGRAAAQPEYVGGVIRSVTCQGYWDAFNDDYFDAAAAFPSTHGSSTTTGPILEAVILQLLSSAEIDLQYWTDPGVSHTPDEFDGQSGSQVVDSLLQEGGTDGNLYDLQFWPGPNDAIMVRLVARVAPDVAQYACDWVPDKNIVDLSYDPHQMYSHVAATYTPDGGSETTTDWQPALTDNSFYDQWGFRRLVKLSTGQKTATGAEQYRDTQQKILSMRQWGGTINVSSAYPLFYEAGDTPVETRTIRGGQWVIVRGLHDPGSDDPIPLLIQTCIYDATSDTAQLTVTRGMTRRDLQRRTNETVDAVRTNRNPLTGAPNA